MLHILFYPRIMCKKLSSPSENLRRRAKSLCKVSRRRWPVLKHRVDNSLLLPSFSSFRDIPSSVLLSLSLCLSFSLCLSICLSLSLFLLLWRIAWTDARSCTSKTKTVPNTASMKSASIYLRRFTSLLVAVCDENACALVLLIMHTSKFRCFLFLSLSISLCLSGLTPASEKKAQLIRGPDQVW